MMLIELHRLTGGHNQDNTAERVSWLVSSDMIVGLSQSKWGFDGLWDEAGKVHTEKFGTDIDLLGGDCVGVAEPLAEVREKWEKAMGGGKQICPLLRGPEPDYPDEPWRVATWNSPMVSDDSAPQQTPPTKEPQDEPKEETA